jgi:hypothetical protein
MKLGVKKARNKKLKLKKDKLTQGMDSNLRRFFFIKEKKTIMTTDVEAMINERKMEINIKKEVKKIVRMLGLISGR